MALNAKENPFPVWELTFYPTLSKRLQFGIVVGPFAVWRHPLGYLGWLGLVLVCTAEK